MKLRTIRQIINEAGNCNRVEVAPDEDGGTVEITTYTERASVGDCVNEVISFSPAQARLVAQAMLQCANEVENLFVEDAEEC